MQVAQGLLSLILWETREQSGTEQLSLGRVPLFKKFESLQNQQSSLASGLSVPCPGFHGLSPSIT